MTLRELVRKSTCAGILIGIGCLMYCMLFEENKILGAFLFSFALCGVFALDLSLYTGKIGFCVLEQDSAYNKNMFLTMFLMLLWNFVGAGIIALIAKLGNIIPESYMVISLAKSQIPFTALLSKSILCGMLMFIAAYSFIRIIGFKCINFVVPIFCVMIFMLSGFEHCIADYFYVFLNIREFKWWFIPTIVFGNSVGSILVSYFSMFKELSKK